jgi:phage/plasmid-like protein (TIGR03299 family)
MAHNINEGKRVMTVGQAPWHGLGTVLDKPATAIEAINAAQLDYKVSVKEIQTKEGIIIPFKKAIIREDTQTPLGVVGNVYTPVQNTEAFSFFDNVVGEGQAIYHTAGALGDGERIWILAKLPKEIVVAREDIVEKYLLLTNTHDGSSALKMYFTPIRVVCQNTLNATIQHSKDGVSIKHSSQVNEKIKIARDVLNLTLKKYDAFESIIKGFAKKSLKVSQVEKYFDTLIMGDTNDRKEETTKILNIKNRMQELFETGKGNQLDGVKGTVWAAYNAVTEFADHHKVVKNLDTDPTNRLKDIWFGASAKLKQDAFDLAMVFAK